MNKKIIAIICLAVLVLSFATARAVNFAIGPSFGYYKGVAPLSDDDSDTNIPYKGTGLGLDLTLSFTFGDQAELFFQDVIHVSGKTAFEDLGNDYLVGTGYSKSYVGYEHAVITDPVKLSVGVAAVFEAFSSVYQYQVGEDVTTLLPIVFNLGIGATVKAESELGKYVSFYVKANADFLPFSVFAITFEPSDDDPVTFNNTTKNFSFGASAGLVFYY